MNNGSDNTPRSNPEPSNVPHIGEQAPIEFCLVAESALAFAGLHDVPVRALCGRWIYPDVLAEAEAAAAGGPAIIEDCRECLRALGADAVGLRSDSA